jgi:hypothetical protein
MGELVFSRLYLPEYRDPWHPELINRRGFFSEITLLRRRWIAQELRWCARLVGCEAILISQTFSIKEFTYNASALCPSNRA